MIARIHLAGAAVAAAFALAPGLARAQTLRVTPIQVELASGAANTLVTLQNLGSEPVRYQVSVMAWGQDPRGEMRLSRTRDVTFFPSLLTVGPGEKRNVRVAAVTSFDAVEKSYRMFVEQLPGGPQSAPTSVKVLTRVGIPVFLEPADRSSRGDVGPPLREGRRLSFTLRNTGNVRIRPAQVRVLGRGASGDVVFEEALPAWYVLAGGERVFETEVPRGDCSRVRSVSAEVVLEKRTMSAQLPTPDGACGP